MLSDSEQSFIPWWATTLTMEKAKLIEDYWVAKWPIVDPHFQWKSPRISGEVGIGEPNRRYWSNTAGPHPPRGKRFPFAASS